MKDLSECRVLIVDDVKANVDVLVQALRSDHKLSVALDGEAALRSIEKNPPDLVLLDIVMPGIDGYEVCRRLRAAEATRDLPVMFLSSLEDVKDKTRGFELGANDYLTKPFEILEVKARVQSLLKAKAYADAVKEAMARELRVARDIQMGLLPVDLGPCTDGTGLDIHALLEPAQEVGGDLYDVVRVGDDRVVVAVGDVSGKGIPAALFMAVTITLLRSMARQFDRPGEILSRVSDELALQNPSGMFVTLQCAVIDLGSGRVTCAGAGHPPPVVLSPGRPPRYVEVPTGGLAGLEVGGAIASAPVELGAGDALLLYTDGVTEAMNAGDECFGEERLIEHLGREPARTATETTAGVLDAVRRHAAGAKQSDDITIVAVRMAR